MMRKKVTPEDKDNPPHFNPIPKGAKSSSSSGNNQEEEVQREEIFVFLSLCTALSSKDRDLYTIDSSLAESQYFEDIAALLMISRWRGRKRLDPEVSWM